MVTWKVTASVPMSVIEIGSAFGAFVGVSDVTDGPSPPTGLMMADVCVIDWPVSRVVQLSVTRTRL